MTRSRVFFAFIVVAGALAPLQGCASSTQQTFASPQAATDALVSALNPRDDASLEQILGPDSEDLISSGDAVADKNGSDAFVAAYNRAHAFVPDTGSPRTLLIGENQWPFPIPLVEKSGTWRFDTPAGKQEILDRRIGANELNAIETCLAYVDAQLEYAMRDPNGDGVREYARKFLSDPGTRNGLYWPTSDDERPSPLGPLAVQASEAGYTVDPAAGPRPYHGYLYAIVLSQGPHAAGGARDYVIDGRMIGGFALVARPATYRNSGVMTFIVNQDGIVYQRDLGSQTETRAKAITTYDPDSSWSRVNQQPYIGPEDKVQ